MKCHQCGSHGRLVSFNTFSYHFCDSCKLECKAPEKQPYNFTPGEWAKMGVNRPDWMLYEGDLIYLAGKLPDGRWDTRNTDGDHFTVPEDWLEPLLRERDQAMDAAVDAITHWTGGY